MICFVYRRVDVSLNWLVPMEGVRERGVADPWVGRRGNSPPRVAVELFDIHFAEQELKKFLIN